MSHRMRTISTNEGNTCEKYLNKMLRHENMYATKKSPVPRPYQERLTNLVKQSAAVPAQRTKPKVVIRQQSPVQKPAAQVVPNLPKEKGDNVGRAKEDDVKIVKRRHRSVSGCRSDSAEREAWGQLLMSNKSKDKVSSFSSFDPLRTLHFLSKELHSKLRNVMPDEEELLQMVSDIQHALKRIPPEVSSLLHTKAEYPHAEHTPKNTSTKTCQTPPTLYQEDTEKFQKIMEENTYRLEASCKQLEMVCTNLQNEKEMTEKELDEAKENVEFLCKRVKDLEIEMEEISNMKIKELEDEKQHLQKELEKAMQEITDNPTMNHLRKLVDELKKQKSSSDETCARLEYDMTLLKMEKEKFATMLSMRDREIKDIQEEMAKIQDQVNKQLKKLNGEVVKRSNSLKALSVSEPYREQENMYLEIGDTTMSSLTATESDREFINIIKECPCGDAEVQGIPKESQDDLLQKYSLKVNKRYFYFCRNGHVEISGEQRGTRLAIRQRAGHNF
jgi:DNA repair exonuclease SbcCD ATPase subunit